jgi:hypothetical protein
MTHENAVAVAEVSPNALTVFDPSGPWVNEMGSTMQVAVNAGVLSGTYTSAQSGGGGSVSGPLQGFLGGDLLAFQVQWPGGSITAWVGHLFVDSGGHEEIKTLWHLVTEIPNPDDPNDFWQSVLAGSDIFTRP